MSVVNESNAVYDLGDVAVGSRGRRIPAPASPRDGSDPAGARTARYPGDRSRAAGRTGLGGVPGGASLSVFLPGAGQLVEGRIETGLFYLTSTGFMAAFGWAILETLGRLSQTLEALGLSRAGGVWMLGVLYVAAMLLHLVNVVTAASGRDGAAHPVVAGAASLVLPGWGQVLNGHRVRAAVFLGALWVAGAAWIVSSAWTGALLEAQGLILPPAADALGSPLVRFTLPAVIWSLAIYDAAVAAAARR